MQKIPSSGASNDSLLLSIENLKPIKVAYNRETFKKRLCISAIKAINGM